LNVLTREQFLEVLNTKKSVKGVNRGFLKKDNHIFTYSQIRTGLTYRYEKRKIVGDGVSTLPIDL